jgi:hypothetical protein
VLPIIPMIDYYFFVQLPITQKSLPSLFKEIKTWLMQYTRTKTRSHNLKLTSTLLFSHTNYSPGLLSMYIMMCINFRITLHVLQNNECGFPLIFTITVVELAVMHKTAHNKINTYLLLIQFHHLPLSGFKSQLFLCH